MVASTLLVEVVSVAWLGGWSLRERHVDARPTNGRCMAPTPMSTSSIGYSELTASHIAKAIREARPRAARRRS